MDNKVKIAYEEVRDFIRDYPNEEIQPFLDQNNVKRRIRRSDCPGGNGKFGFNSYNMMAAMLMSFNQVSNVVVNTNNNRNNNNNNDFQATFGSINTQQSSAEATQMSGTMTMITVPPTGTPVVIPLGRILTGGGVVLDEGVEEEGVSWESPYWRMTDTGMISYKQNVSWDGGRAPRGPVVGVQYFGTVDRNNVFHLLPNNNKTPVTLAQIRALNLARNTTQGSQDRKDRDDRSTPPVLKVSGSPVLVRQQDLQLLHARLLEREGKRVVLVAVPRSGPPLTLPLGWLLPGGMVHLDRGVEVEGIYWESLDRILWSDGRVEYKGTGVVEKAAVMFGTVGQGGVVNVIPNIAQQPVTLGLLRRLNINQRMTKNTNTYSIVTNDSDKE